MCTWFSASFSVWQKMPVFMQTTISPTSLFSANFNGNRVKNHPKPWTCPLKIWLITPIYKGKHLLQTSIFVRSLLLKEAHRRFSNRSKLDILVMCWFSRLTVVTYTQSTNQTASARAHVYKQCVTFNQQIKQLLPGHTHTHSVWP